jgi:hypothetical protein
LSELPKASSTALVIIAVIDLALFSNMTVFGLIAYVIGALGLALGILYSYKPSAIVGLLLTGVAGAASMEFTSLLDTGPLFAAIVGLMIPMFVITWIALSLHEESSRETWPARKTVSVSVLYAGLVLVSTPLISLLLSLFVPSVTTRFTTVTEAAILFVVLTVSAVILTGGMSAPGAPELASEGVSKK